MNKEGLVAYIENFKNFKVLVVGDVFLDHYIFGKVERLNPEAPVPILHAQKETLMTGGAGNVAKNLASLGGSTILVGVIGSDMAAEQIKSAAKAEQYEFKAVSDNSRPTIRKVRYLVNSQQLLRVDFEETNDISEAVENQLIKEITDASSKVDAILISDYAKGVITKRVAQAVMAIAKEKSIPVAADIKPSRAALVTGVAFISPNLKEGHEFLGLNPLEHDKKEPAEIALELAEKMNTDVFLTLGADGIYVETRQGVREHIPQEHASEVFDVSGAGDTAMSTLLLSRLAGASPQECAQLANAAGAVVVSKVGSVAVTPQELKDMIMHHHE